MLPIEVPDAARQPEAYVSTLLELLGDRDPVDVLAATPNELPVRCERLALGAWTRRASKGEWSVQELIGHFVDVEVVYAFRLRLVLTTSKPSYPGYDEKAWARLARPKPSELLATFAAIRTGNLVLISAMASEDWHRVGCHAEQGDEDVRRMVDKLAGHDIAHLDQLARTVDAVLDATTGQFPHSRR